MDIEQLNTTLTDVENELLKRKMEKLASGERTLETEPDTDELDSDEETEEPEEPEAEDSDGDGE